MEMYAKLKRGNVVLNKTPAILKTTRFLYIKNKRILKATLKARIFAYRKFITFYYLNSSTLRLFKC